MAQRVPSTRLFKSDFMERFSHVHPMTPPVLFGPVVLVCLYLPWAYGSLPPLQVFGLFLVGLVNWSLLEYWLHRVVFHFKPQTKWLQRIFYIIHQVHHDYPNELNRLVMPPALSVPLAGLLLWGHWSFFQYYGLALMAGVVLGYIIYDYVHYSVHAPHTWFKGFKWQRRAHLLHHFDDPTRAYGVSTPIWDYVFGTVATQIQQSKEIH